MQQLKGSMKCWYQYPFLGYPTWATKQWFLCSKYYIKLQFSKKKKEKRKKEKKKKKALSSLSTQLAYERDQLYICDGFLSYAGYY